MKENYLFEYIPGNSLLNRINPLAKLLSLIIFCIAAGIINSWFLIIPALLLFPFTITSRRALAGQLKSIIKLLLFFLFVGVVRFRTSSSLSEGISMTAKLIMMMLAGLLFYTTTRLAELKRNLPPSSFMDMIIISLTILPLIFKTSGELKNARFSRCCCNKKNPLRAVKLTAVPLMIEMFIKTDQLADAWYSRAYRTKT